MADTCPNDICEGPCVCSELDAFVAELQGTNITQAIKMRMDMFDVGVGRALHNGEKIVNLMVHNPGQYHENDPSMRTFSWGRAETSTLIKLLIRGYREQWGDSDDE